MKTKLLGLLALTLLSALSSPLSTAFAQNIIVTYQGRVTSNGTNFDGAGQFKFVLVTSTNHNHTATATPNVSGGFVTTYNMTFGGNGYLTVPAVTISGGGGSGATGHASVSGGVVTSVTADSPGSGYTSTPTVTIAPPPDNTTFTTLWSNDGTSVNGSAPAAAVSASVAGGLFTIPLGDTTLENMLALDAALFTQPNLQLRIWFNDAVNGFAVLSPVQELTFAPHAAYASRAAFSQSASNLIGTLPSGNLAGTYAGAVTFNNAGNSFAGSGAGLTSLNASQLTSGTVADARLSANVALRNANQTFTGVNTFNNAGNSFNGTFSGNGAGISNISLVKLNSAGTIDWLGSFLFASSPGVGNGPISVAAADVNGDGNVDLISANFNAATLTVLTNNGRGGFVLSSSPGVGSAPRSVTAADVNGDGKLDLISANQTANTLTVLTNNGSGSFVLSSSPSVGNGPGSVVAADVNGDGKADLISANFGANTLTVLTNNGSGGFVLASSPGVGTGPESVTAADVNGDGKVDLINANFNANTLTVLTNNGSGGFVLSSSPGVGSNPNSVTAADVNGDGKVDLISANFNAATLTVLTNNGSGGFVLASSPGVGTGPESVTAADVNGDGKMDLISANYGSIFGTGNTLTVLINNDSGGFVLASSPSVGSGSRSVTAADVNGDGTVDLINANQNANTLSVLFNVPTFTGNFVGKFTGNFPDGNVGIGTATPYGTLSLGGADPLLHLGATATTGWSLQKVDSNGRIRLYEENAGSSGERLTILSGGNVGIGTSLPTAKLHVEGNTRMNGEININNFGFAGTPMTVQMRAGDSAVFTFRDEFNGHMMSLSRSPNELNLSGAAFKSVGGTSWGTFSDRRLKERVRPFEAGLNTILQLQPVRFHYRDDTKRGLNSTTEEIGFIAQDVQQVLPEAVSEGKDGYLMLKADPIHWAAINAIQELNQSFTEELKRRDAENAELKARLEKLERLMSAKNGGGK